MKRPLAILLLLVVLLGFSIWMLLPGNRSAETGGEPLLVHCAAALREPVGEIAAHYERKFGIPIQLQFGGSGALESQLELVGGDLFLPADDSYIASARNKGFVCEAIPIASLIAGIVVPEGNPKNLRTLDDLTRPGIRLSLADRSAAIGQFTRSLIDASGRWDRIEPNVLVTKPTANNIVEDVVTGAVDATIAWDAVAAGYPQVEWIAVPRFNECPAFTSVGLLTSAANPARALHFARFLAARDRGLPVFAASGFRVAATADRWVSVPEVNLVSGSGLRPAIQERLREFERREGCRIHIVPRREPSTFARDVEFPQLMARLRGHLSSSSARIRFEELGFTWKIESPDP